MEKTCEYCAAPRPIVYCKADSALLCLSCDSKVHSANALSTRHSRTLICDSCRHNPVNFRCLDHLMLLCRDCDAMIHCDYFPQHKRLMVDEFSGCPSADSFAALWGFGISEHYQETTMKNCLIMQQILDLKRIQLSEVDDNSKSPLLRRYDEFTQSSKKLHGLNQQLQGLDSHVDNLQSLYGSSSVQVWSQNIEDLGVCEEPGFADVFNIPNLDGTFHNFEDLFPGDMTLNGSLLGEDDLIWSENENETNQELSASSVYVVDQQNKGDNKKFNSGFCAFSSPSRFSAESSGSECRDSSKQRKKTRMNGKQTPLSQQRKSKADTHKRIKSRCTKYDGSQTQAANATNGY